MTDKRKNPGDIISGVTILVLFVVILTLVVFAARGYQFAVETQDGNGNIRALSAYISSCVRDNNSDTVNIENRSGRECLVITSKDGYEQRFYLDGGSLMEEYGQAGEELRPDSAITIGSTDTLELTLNDDGLLEIHTDGGHSYVNTARN